MEKQSKRHQSSVWNRFRRYELEGIKMMRCLECGLELKTHLASNAKRHLRTVHKLVDPDLDDLLNREENRSTPQRLNDQMLSLFLEVTLKGANRVLLLQNIYRNRDCGWKRTPSVPLLPTLLSSQTTVVRRIGNRRR